MLNVRVATPSDAPAIAELSAEFVRYLARLGDPAPGGITADEVLREGFGDHAAFGGFVAEFAGRIVGYLLHHPGYDVDRGGRVWYVFDLFVTATARRAGVGRALMIRARHACQDAGGRALIWTVYPPNLDALHFYQRLGATVSEDRILTWLTAAATDGV
ncbi:MAG TPA: GNAT family N-acetyltransferase [Gemmatimonadaceae bacterium]|nr:GNAT family N-acetyltransferase [Gemmatimonadaceae bacterium]